MKADPQIDVVHFIPSVTLCGTREQKLQVLDLLIEHLRKLRMSLADEYSPATAEITPIETHYMATWRDLRVAAVMLHRDLIRRIHRFFIES